MDKKEALKIVQEDVVGGLKNLPDEFKKDKDIVLAAVKGYGDALQFAHKNLKGDKKFIIKAVSQNGNLQFADNKLKADKHSDVLLDLN